MHDFEYEAPTSLDRAIELMTEHSGSICPLAGGTDLIDQMRIGRLVPKFLVDVKKIDELNVLEADGTGLRVGATVSCHRIFQEDVIIKQYSALADSCHIIGGIQIQSRASIGGNLCNSGPAADSVPSIIALGGICVIAGPNGIREVSAEDFCTGPGTNVLQNGELLVEMRFPKRPPNSGSHYRRFIPRNEMDIAVVGVGASVILDEDGMSFVSARVALGAVAPIPLFAGKIVEALEGQPVAEETFTRAADVAREIISPITDMRGTKEYRYHITGMLTERVLKGAVSRAKGEKLSYKPGQ